MIKIGRWIGQYKFDKEVNQKMIGFDHTNFEIEIISIDKNKFQGKVQDDITTGGTEGIGEIQGKIVGNTVKFIKQMPIMTILFDKEGERKTFNRKHSKIYYSGTYSSDKKSIGGHWRIKFGLIWIGLFPIVLIPTKGTWTMSLKE
jgi:hypothetical protein